MDQIKVQNAPGADPAEGKFDNLAVEIDGNFVRVSAAPEPVADPADSKPEAEAPKPEVKQEAVKEERPSWLPEKFKSVEDMAKAYSELEKKLSAPKKDEPKPEEKKDEKKDGEEKPAEEKKDGEEKPTEEKKDEKPTNEEREEVKAVLAKVNLSIDKYEAEFDQNGTLSEDSYKELEAAGFSKRFVDSYVDGQRALVTKAMDEVWARSGGSAESYTEMTKWMQQSLPVEEIKAYNAEIMKQDRAHVLSTVENMYKKFTEANGKPGTLVHGKAPASAPAGDTYKSWDEVQKDMADQRYKDGDPAFHRMVDAKLSRSKI